MFWGEGSEGWRGVRQITHAHIRLSHSDGFRDCGLIFTTCLEGNANESNPMIIDSLS